MARIGINTRFLLKGKMEGFGWYTYEICKRIVQKHPEHQFIFFFDRPYDKSFIFGENVEAVVLTPSARHPLLFILWFDLLLPKALKKYNVDVFFSPDGYLSLRTEIPQICTIHDINFEHYPKDLPRSASWYLRRYFPRFAEKADHIVTVSEYSKNDLCKTYSIPNTMVTAVWNGASENFKPIGENEVSQIRDKFTNGRPYFVFVGSIHPRKNLKRLIEAFALYSDQNPSAWDLVVVGENMWKGKNKLDIPESILDKVHFTGRLSQEDLAKVVGSAESLAYIPYFEGFGIPLVEAMKCGIPIISGDRTSLPEVAGEAALYCDPFDANSVKQALEKMSNNDEIRNDLKRKSIQRADLFSWDKAADQTWSEIEKILPSHNKAKS